MADYMKKHAEQLKLGHKLRQLGAILPLAATLSVAACSDGGNVKPQQESGLLAHDSITDQDYFGHSVTLKHVSVRLYNDKNLTPTKISQLRWGTPAEEMPDIYHGQKTFAKRVRYGGENDRAYIEVFENEFGVLISKDQPCFIVDSSNTLVYFGDADTFIKNMDRYVQEKQIRKLETKAARSVEKNTATITSENKDTVSLDTLMSDVKEVQIDSIIQEIEKDSVIRKKNDDTLQNGQLNIDTIIKKKDNPIKE